MGHAGTIPLLGLRLAPDVLVPSSWDNNATLTVEPLLWARST